MKKAVLTISTGKQFKEMAEVTHPTLKAYADKCGADFIVWDQMDPKFLHAGFMKYNISKLFDAGYDRVLYLDTDILIRDDCPDLFEKVPEGSFAAFYEGNFVNRQPAMAQYARLFNQGEFANHWVAGGQYFNSGVMLIDKEAAPAFSNVPSPLIESFYEQTGLNYQVARYLAENPSAFTVCRLNYKYNRMSCMDRLTGEPRHDSFILHYAGVPREGIVNRIKEDLEIWENRAANWPKNICLNAGGGLGDVIASEPLVRYAKEHVWPVSNMIVRTPWPEVFEHLKEKGVTVVHEQDEINDVGYFVANLMPKEQDLRTEMMRHTLVHPLTYASIMALRAEIPIRHRQINLKTEPLPKDVEDYLHNAVLIHAGKSWESKTFPPEFWNETVKAIKAEGFKVAFIGRDMGDYRGAVEVDYSQGLNLVNQLSRSEMFRAIELAPVLISNDSAPVHAAGAFDNWVGMIATCKHHDRIFPWRNGSQRYKASALQRGLINFEFAPTSMEYVAIDKATPERVAECLPEPKQIAEWVTKIPSRLKADKLGE